LPLASLERESAVARREAIGDVFLHPVIEEVRPATLDQIQRLQDAGYNSIKIFMVSEAFDRDAPGFVEATRLAGQAGMLTLFHCEDHALIGAARARLVAQGRTSIRHYPESAPVVSEAVATQRAVAIAELTGAPIYVVHVSSARALEVCAEAQARGVPVYVETRPLYLHLTRERFEEEEGQRYVGQPPLRDTTDADALWAGLRSGAVHTVCSDHAPYSLAAKLDAAHTIEQLRAGVENLQTLRPMLYSEGVRTGRISLQRFVELTATNAARLFGLYPRKGTIAPGSDADLVLFDPNLTRTVEPAMLKSNADYSVFEGWEVTGWPVTTLSRGEIVFEHDRVIGAPGRGELLPRGATQML
jgi:dihydropyrimidinase